MATTEMTRPGALPPALPAAAPPPPAGVVWFPGEAVLLLAVAMPRLPAHQRRMALAYAVEDHLAEPLDAVEVMAVPLDSNDGAGTGTVSGTGAGRALAAVAGKAALALAMTSVGRGQRLVPDLLAVPCPPQGWAVWVADSDAPGRMLVRLADGTGFACTTAEFAALLALGGSPELVVYGKGLAAFPTLVPRPLPPPGAALRRFDLAAGSALAGSRSPRAAMAVAAVLLAALALHLVVMAVDVADLRRAEASRAAAVQAALLARGQPGIAPEAELAALLAAAEPMTGGSFLPLLARIAAVLQPDSALQFQALGWTQDGGAITLAVTAPDLPALQKAEAALTLAGLGLDMGPATTGDGLAEAQMILTAGLP